MKHIAFATILILLCCCENKKEEIRHNIEKFKSQPISLSLDKMQLYYKADNNDIVEKDLKLIVYVDSTMCSSCYLKSIDRWYYMLDSLYAKSDNFESIFIMSPKKAEVNDIKYKLDFLRFDYPVYLDSVGIFDANNPHMPKESMYHTFLLDKRNYVLVVGNPLNDKKTSEKILSILDETK